MLLIRPPIFFIRSSSISELVVFFVKNSPSRSLRSPETSSRVSPVCWPTLCARKRSISSLARALESDRRWVHFKFHSSVNTENHKMQTSQQFRYLHTYGEVEFRKTVQSLTFPYYPGQCRTHLDDKGYSKAQPFSRRVRSTDRGKPTAKLGIHPRRSGKSATASPIRYFYKEYLLLILRRLLWRVN